MVKHYKETTDYQAYKSKSGKHMLTLRLNVDDTLHICVNWMLGQGTTQENGN